MTAHEEIAAAIAAFDRALVSRDYPALRAMLAEDYLMINPLGHSLDKAGWLSWIDSDIQYHQVTRQHPAYRTYGEATVVTSAVQSAMSVRGYLNGEPSVHSTVRTEIWVRLPEGLRLAHIHLTRPAA